MNPTSATKTGQVFDWLVLRRLLTYVTPYRTTFIGLIALTVATAVLGTVRPALIQRMVDVDITNNDWAGLNRSTTWLLGLLLVHTLVSYLQTYYGGWLGQYIVRDIRTDLFRHLLSLKLSFFDRTPIGVLVTRNISDVETLADVFSEGLAAMVGDLLQIVFLMIFMFWTNWQLALISLSVIPPLLFSTYVFKEKVKGSFQEVRNAVAKLNSFVQEHLTGMNVVQIFNNETREYKKFKDINEEHTRANIKSVLYYSIYFPVAEVLGAIGVGLLVWYAAQGQINGSISKGELIAFIMYNALFFRPIRQIADRFNTLQLGLVSTERLLKLLDSKDLISSSGTLTVPQLQGEVEFDHVWFAYNQQDGPTDDPEWVLRDISFHVQPGQTVAFVGATGAGKTSIINLLSRFYDIQQGHIKVDGHDLRDYDLSQLRRQIGVVLQDVFLFAGSIRANITLGNRDISDAKIWEAAALVGAQRFIERLPGGLDYPVMERGATLSVGQRQLISFVRALVYEPRVIVLDEATSSVDSETEEMIQGAIDKLMEGRTALVIAHRLSTIQKADRIIVLDRGEIKETGTHDELLRLGGYYAQLYRMQYASSEQLAMNSEHLTTDTE
ncbi:ABC transporter ATP-binding protein [Hymenobacter sp. UV11]|uniref:ABC transporter ATP-binding protein n=1 Tax=Hymenobacter sp. UV11 TaxID=1849735 RepID=UPI00105C8CE8|nr:ABC transporter ATP-binding protein [Hymenobacter sp. UV11]TDN36319.1 antibiotic ABC transporter ATP-binding protein [Hymenobacter sp. UV11]TFZ67030.1 ABC transporter ATP-binding protein [Hymenobacter sp. UV11]